MSVWKMYLCDIPGVGKMAEKGLWNKEIYAGKFKVLASIPILVITALMITLGYDFTIRMMEAAPMPDFAREQLELMKDFRFYVWSQWFGKNLYQMGSFIAILFGFNIISSEVSRRTMHFLLAKPIRRQDVFKIKYIVNYASLVLVVVISTAVLYISAVVAGRGYPLLQLIENTVIAIAGMGALFSMAVYFSTVFDSPAKSFTAAFLTALALFAPGFSPALAKFSVYYQMAGAGIFKSEGFPLIPMVVFVLVSVGLYVLGSKRFVKGDM